MNIIKKVFLEILNNNTFYINLLKEHIFITFIAFVIALTFGICIGVFISSSKKFAAPIISFVNIVYTIPSISLLGLLISITGIGNTTAIIALSIYALLPVVRSTYIGIENIDKSIIEASEAMGSTKNQILFKIKFPLAFPVIISGIRSMVTMTIALAGIASFVGAGGLGVAIYRGITTNNKILQLTGSILIASLTLFADFILSVLEKKIKNGTCKFKMKIYILVVLSLVTLLFSFSYTNKSKNIIKIASKPVTENYILAELTAQLVENKTDLKVMRTFGVGGGTSNLHPAILKGDFDMYPEYTGTSWQIVLKEKEIYSEKRFKELSDKYLNKYNLVWAVLYGFNDTYGLGLRKELAEKYNIETYSDLAKYSQNFIFGAEYDFFEREDGFNGLVDKYKFKFKKQIDMDNGLKYQALFDNKIDVMTVFTTDGQLSDDRIVVLKDDLEFYPSYMAGLILRKEVIEKYPELKKIVSNLNYSITEQEMSKMNYEVEVERKKVEDVAYKFLEQKGLIGGKNE